MSSWGWGSFFFNLQAVNDFSIFGSKSSPFYFTSRWEAFFCEKLKKEEPSFFLIFFAFCRYCADCSSKLPYIRVFLKKFDGFEFWCGLIFNQLKHTPAQAPTVSLRGPAQDLQKRARSASFGVLVQEEVSIYRRFFDLENVLLSDGLGCAGR